MNIAFRELTIRLLGLAGLASALAFFSVFVFLHWFSPGVILDYISDYANTPYGGLFQVVLALHGLGNLAIAFGLLLSIRSSRMGEAATVLLMAASAGTVIAAIVPTDPSGASATLSGSLHIAAAFVSFMLEALSIVLLAPVFWEALSWRAMAIPTLCAVGIGMAGFVWLFTSWQTGAPTGFAEHAAVMPFFWWETIVALRLMALRLF